MMSADLPATRATIRATVTALVWFVRVTAYVLHGIAGALDAAATYADTARGITPPEPARPPTPERQPRLPA
jgi:hypothetical protein